MHDSTQIVQSIRWEQYIKLHSKQPCFEPRTASDSSTVDAEIRLQTASFAIKSIVQGIYVYLPILRYIINYIIVFDCTHSRERVTETKSSCWKTVFTDRSIHRRTKYRATGLPTKLLSFWLISLAEPTKQSIQSHQHFYQVPYAHPQATPLYSGGPNRTRRRQAPLRRSRGEYFMKSPSLIVGKLVAPFSLALIIVKCTINNLCDLHSIDILNQCSTQSMMLSQLFVFVEHIILRERDRKNTYLLT